MGSGFGEVFRNAGINSFICSPAKLDERVYGYLYVDNPLGEKPFPAHYLPYVRLLCSQIAVGLYNMRIYDEMRVLRDRFQDEAIFYKREMGVEAPTEMIVGKSKAIRHVIEQVRQVALTTSSVLVVGETGVGKELIAKAIHNLSKRRDGPFIPVNLAGFPQELVASELFGHEKGAFTGAYDRHKGRFELAHGGTIFLDEIGDLPLSVQVKLLRVLQEGSFERLGSTHQILSDFRVIAATNKDLQEEIEKGTFRQDLYYRLNVFPIRVPPLRERAEDIPSLIYHFVDRFSKDMGKKIDRISNKDLRRLTEYPWPGNVRELQHVVERSVILSNGPGLSFASLESSSTSGTPENKLSSVFLRDVERNHILKVLDSTFWKVKGHNGAAAMLGIKPTTLFSRMKKLGIKRGTDPDAPP
jgi:transcriptional regulator with GAF, ATPase, and Fis domain